MGILHLLSERLLPTHDTNENVFEDESSEKDPENDVECWLELAVVYPQVFQQCIPLIHGK